jgi:alkaline phosphatase
MNKIFLTSIGIILTYFSLNAQYTTLNAHSHNDYEQKKTFQFAYKQHFGSIEADIWAVAGDLYVAHEQTEITKTRSLDALYIRPIVSIFAKNKGKAWSDQKGTFQLLIELKSATEPTLSLLVAKLQKYPTVFNPKVNRNAVRVVITGNVPKPEQFKNYPDFIQFDGDLTLKYTQQQRARLGMYSNDLENFTHWKGKGAIPTHDKNRMKQIIDSIHELNCKIRFWNAPDNPNAWQELMNLKVDYVNTDHIRQLATFLKSNKLQHKK